MRSPKSRIQQLKQEIAELEQKLVTTCAPAPPATNLEDPPAKPTRSSLNPDPCKKLRILSVKKPFELAKPREKSVGKAKLPEEGKKPLKEDFTINKSKFQEERLSIIAKETERMQKERLGLEREQLKNNEEQAARENLSNMCREEIISRASRRGELIGLREELEFVLETIEIQHADDLEFCGDDVQTQSNVRAKPGLDNSIENNKILISALEKKYLKVLSDIESLLCNGGNSKLNREILQIEKNIEEKTSEFDLDCLENVILDLNALERFDIDEEILRLQLKEVITSENKLKLDFDYSEREIQEKMKASSSKRETAKLENELSFLRNQYRNRFAAINHWKEEVENVISRTVSNIHVSVNDRTIVDEFVAALGKITSVQSRQQLKNVMEGYANKVNMRDKMIQSNLAEIKKKFIEKNQIAGLMSKAQIEKNKLQSERFKFSKENLARDGVVEKTQRKSEATELAKEKAAELKSKILALRRLVEAEEAAIEKLKTHCDEIEAEKKSLVAKTEFLRSSLSKIEANQAVLSFG